MTPLKPDFNSPKHKEEQRKRKIDFELNQLGCLLDQRKELEEKISRVSSILEELQRQS